MQMLVLLRVRMSSTCLLSGSATVRLLILAESPSEALTLRFSHLSMLQHHLETPALLGPTSRISESLGLGEA